MSRLERVTGDILDMAENGYIQYLVHGCNCFNTMKSGIAGQLAKRYPVVKEADKVTVRGDRKKLGRYVTVPVRTIDAEFIVVNAYTQYAYGSYNDFFEYDAFADILSNLKTHLESLRFSGECVIGFPYIGMGLAGGDSERIIPMIEQFADSLPENFRTVLVKFEARV